MGRQIGDIGGNVCYDAARANWSGSWRLPTYDEMMELFESCNICIYIEGKEKGWQFTSKSNGNSVFFPFAGAQPFDSALFGDVDKYGNYWTSTAFEHPGNNDSYFFMIDIEGCKGDGAHTRYEGLSIRPVSE